MSLISSNKVLAIIKGMKNPLDYAEYSQSCREQEIEPLDEIRYAESIGPIGVAMKSYGSDDPRESYFTMMSTKDRRVRGGTGYTTKCCPGAKVR